MTTTVLVAGAGPVGFALAVELGIRGIRCTVVEPRLRTRLVPRAKLVNVRTMEHMRRWRLADELRRETPLPADYSTDIAFVTSVLGHEITRFTNVFFTRLERDDRFAEPAQQAPQYMLEPVLRRRPEQLSCVTFLDGWRVDSFVDVGDRVDVIIQDDGSRRQAVRASYGSALALVRPDQVLVWHGDTLPSNPGKILDVVTGRLMCSEVADVA